MAIVTVAVKQYPFSGEMGNENPSSRSSILYSLLDYDETFYVPQAVNHPVTMSNKAAWSRNTNTDLMVFLALDALGRTDHAKKLING